MRAGIDDAAGIHDDDAIGELDRAEPVGDDQRGTAGGEFAQRDLNLLLAL